MDYSNERYRRFNFLLNLKLLKVARLLLRAIVLRAFAVTGRIAAGFLDNRGLEELRTCDTAAPEQCCNQQQ